MKLKIDTLKCVKLLEKTGVQKEVADGVITTLSDTEVWNVYSKEESDTMLSETVDKVFDKYEKRWEEQRREFDRHMQTIDRHTQTIDRRLDAEIAESRSGRRWVMGTIITVGLALAGYLSALIHLTH